MPDGIVFYNLKLLFMPVAAAIPIAAAAIQAGSSIAGAAAQSSMNKATREWNERMYAMQRNDAMMDWNRQNEYNSPAAQMERFKAAGLNPNLIYGQTNEAPAVRSTDVKSWNPTAPSYGAGVGNALLSGLASYQDMTMQDEQIKNMQAQRQNLALDSLIKGADIFSKNLKNAKDVELYDTYKQTAIELLRGITTRTDVAVSQEARDAAMHAPSLQAAFERIANISADTAKKNAEISLLKGSGVLQDLEIGLRNKGMSWNDPLWARMLMQFAGDKPLPDVVKDMLKQFREVTGTNLPSKVISKYLGTKEFHFGPVYDRSGKPVQFKFSDWQDPDSSKANRGRGLSGMDRYFNRK